MVGDGKLDDYRQKRDFGRTPEPPGRDGDGRSAAARFVVHRHDARNLHFDLRLEIGGVLESWAVPKGFSYDPGTKRLAVRTEDHPLEYLRFAGVIPPGQYGAGTMTIWDRGEFIPLTPDPASAVDGGKLEFRLRGSRLRGEWHLVKTRSDAGNQWLLFKARDVYAGCGLAHLTDDLAGARRAAKLPARIRFMLAGRNSRPFSDPDWVFELEYAGRRAIIRKNDEDVTVALHGRRPGAADLGPVVADAASIHVERCIVDGVLVALDEFGRPDRELLERRMREGDAASLCFFAFDLPFWEEWDLRPMPLLARKRRLKAILPRAANLLFGDHVAGVGEHLAAIAQASGFSGLVAKRSDRGYRVGPSEDWRRITLVPEVAAATRPLTEVLDAAHAPDRPSPSRVRYSNLEKVFWRDQGMTKGALLAYYDRVSEFLIPHLEGRPVHMHRFPDGIDGKDFFQRRAPAGIPQWVATADIEDARGVRQRHVVCNDRDTLLYLVNLGSIDLHPWMARLDSLDRPDYAVLDLDPKEASFAAVLRVARIIHKLLASIGIRAFLKTSGKSGVHVVLPLGARYPWDVARGFCEGVARIVAREHPQLATVERHPARRGGRVYVDYLQNGRGQTVVPPYVVRPVAAATVSTPLSWEEIDEELDRESLTMAVALARLDEFGDLMRDVHSLANDLESAIDAIVERLQE